MNIDKSVFRWDHYSDQPHTLDRRTKRSLRRSSIGDGLKKLLSFFLLVRPVWSVILRRPALRPYHNEHGIGLCLNLERPLDGNKVLSAPEIAEIIRPLNLDRIAVRIPLHDLDSLQEYVDFIGHFSRYKVLGVILQDRRFIEDPRELESALRCIFAALSGVIDCYQIGNAVNRLKWGFVSQREWFEFFRVAWNLRNESFPAIKLLGGAIIDFELLDHARSLHNGFPFRYDGYASLLYVDRRGAPENRQMGLDLRGKISLLRRIMHGSVKLASPESKLWITEINWPLLDTGRYAPSLDDCRVDERDQLLFLVRYFLLVLGTGPVAGCFWHQLVAPGYGLIDNRRGAMRKRPAFQGFATVCGLFNGARIEAFDHEDELGHFLLTACRNGREIRAVWRSEGTASMLMPADKVLIDIEGRTIATTPGQRLMVGDSPIYLVDEDVLATGSWSRGPSGHG